MSEHDERGEKVRPERHLVEMRTFGPPLPGTGKTTFLARQVRAAVERHGPGSVLVASFTRAAAEELAGRDMPVDRGRIGTLHAHARRALGGPPLAVDRVKQWNAEHPAYALTTEGSKSGDDDDDLELSAFGGRKTSSDEIAEQYHALRGRLVDPEWWPMTIRAFAERWEAWKRENDVLDFTDLIEMAPAVSPVGRPTIGFFDEVQDFTPLELRLVRAWGEGMARIVLAGDDDQAIYGFKGASPEAFLHPPVPDELKRVLSQSYRVPATVHAAAQAWVGRLSVREPKAYKPRDADGEVEVMEHARSRCPLPALMDAERGLAEGKRVMFLATCSYMLDPLIGELRRHGVPFHNPYARKRGDWNPLGFKRKGATSTSERLVGFSRVSEDIWGDGARMWTADEMLAWVEPLLAEVFVPGGKKALVSALKEDRAVTADDLAEFIRRDADDPLEHIVETDLEWYESHVLAAYRKRLFYPMEIARNRGIRALAEPPKLLVGTVHSVKGTEAEWVYLFPDLSPSAARQWIGEAMWDGGDAEGGDGDDPDSIVRLLYVAMTRAKERLVVCGKSSPLAVEPYELIEGAL